MIPKSIFHTCTWPEKSTQWNACSTYFLNSVLFPVLSYFCGCCPACCPCNTFRWRARPFNFNFVHGFPTMIKMPQNGSLRISATATTVEQQSSSSGDISLPSLKTELLRAVAGLDRGLVANEADVMALDTSARKLEASGGIVDLSTDIDKLQGKWRLVYSSAFASGSLGGFRPGPPTGRLPLSLGQVFQRIDVGEREFDNIVNLQIGTPWPLPPIEVTATLAHKFEVIDPASIRIIFERTIVQPAGGLSQLPTFELPQLPEVFRPPPTIRSGEFKVTFLDDEMRITRGDRGELRVFFRS